LCFISCMAILIFINIRFLLNHKYQVKGGCLGDTLTSVPGFFEYLQKSPPRALAVSEDCKIYSLKGVRDCKKKVDNSSDFITHGKCIHLTEDKKWINPLQRPPRIFYPGLTSHPWWDPSVVRATKVLEENFDIIYGEYNNLLKLGKLRHHPDKLAEGSDWKIFTLWSFGRKISNNTKLCPETTKIIESLPESYTHVYGLIYFSMLYPGTHIKSHCGPTNIRLRIHMGLDTPQRATMRVGNDRRSWEKGKCILFDDSYEHEVWHEGDSPRAVLLLDIWHPDLNEQERQDLINGLYIPFKRDY